VTSCASGRSTQHACYVVERSFAAPISRVFAAWSNEPAKSQWFTGTMDGEDVYSLDFRIEGEERAAGGPAGGPVFTYRARYHDIVWDQRIVYTYTLDADQVRLSLSIVTVELTAVGSGSKLTYSDAAVYLDGRADPASRQHGTEIQLDTLASMLL
jgi:uncharacterized protein YndB with AHSA1/START domain